MGNYYYDFSELVTEMEQLNRTANNIYSRQDEILTEIKELREDLKDYHAEQAQALTFISVLILISTVIKVMFK